MSHCQPLQPASTAITRSRKATGDLRLVSNVAASYGGVHVVSSLFAVNFFYQEQGFDRPASIFMTCARETSMHFIASSRKQYLPRVFAGKSDSSICLSAKDTGLSAKDTGADKLRCNCRDFRELCRLCALAVHNNCAGMLTRIRSSLAHLFL